MLEIAAGKLALAAAGAIVAGGTALGVNTAGGCPAGQETTIFGCAKVTNAPDERGAGYGKVSSVTPSGGVDFRDVNGDRTSSGLSPADRFQYVGQKRKGKNGDGPLILVKQLTHGKGGWGPLYLAWIPVKYTADPTSF